MSVVSKDGLLFMGKGSEFSKEGSNKVKGWKQKWLVLCGSTLYYYNKQTNFSPAGCIEIHKTQLQLAENVQTDKKFAFGLASKGKTYIFSCASEEERGEWLAQLHGNKDKEPQPPPASNKEKKGIKYSFETNVASSMVGRKIIKEALPAEAWQVLEAVCSFLGQVKGMETAEEFKKSFLKIGTKIGLLHHNKLLTDDDIYKYRQTFLKLGMVVVDFYQMPSVFDCQTILKFLTDMKRGMEEKLTPLLTARSIEKLTYVFGVVCDEALIANFFQKKKWKELDTVAVILRANLPANRGDVKST